MKSDLNKYELVKDTLVLILAGGRGSRLHELTDKRAKPALYFGGNRRIIDFALSNCSNSGLNRVGVVTQYAAHSLLRHILIHRIRCTTVPSRVINLLASR